MLGTANQLRLCPVRSPSAHFIVMLLSYAFCGGVYLLLITATKFPQLAVMKHPYQLPVVPVFTAHNSTASKMAASAKRFEATYVQFIPQMHMTDLRSRSCSIPRCVCDGHTWDVITCVHFVWLSMAKTVAPFVMRGRRDEGGHWAHS